ncbi:hypothetical protein AMTR_s00024p00108110 [Amborella trichopoda]|uniref:CASP-like protein n=1 Tax=Amborella trichopoda TaxID=13333 RepID=W1PTM3_AMBTC|nr:hypothetical protein AMTR_s00024p00108110 [Amborella trichopoda]
MASSRAIPIATILLRILTFILLAVATVVLVTDKVKSKDVFGNTSEITFKDIRAYRYVLAASVIGCAYTLIQIPFAVYWVATSKRMIHNDCLPNFDFYGDKVSI